MGQLVAYLTGRSFVQLQSQLMLPYDFHFRFNLFIFAITVPCFLVKISLVVAKRWPALALSRWTHWVRGHDLKFGFLFGLYLVGHILVYLAEMRYTGIWGWGICHYMHHATAIVGFLVILLATKRHWSEIGPVQILPFILHAVYWSMSTTDIALIAYNVSLAVGAIEMYLRCPKLRLASGSFVFLVNSNYWTYCVEFGRDYPDMFCPGRYFTPKGSNWLFNSSIVSAVFFFFLVSIPVMMHAWRTSRPRAMYSPLGGHGPSYLL